MRLLSISFYCTQVRSIVDYLTLSILAEVLEDHGEVRVNGDQRLGGRMDYERGFHSSSTRLIQASNAEWLELANSCFIETRRDSAQ